MKNWLLFVCLLLCVTGCSDDEANVNGGVPVIKLDSESARYKVKSGYDLVISPAYEGVDANTSYVWKLDQKIVGRESSYTFNKTEVGEYYVSLQVMNSYGVAEEELKIKVLSLKSPMISLYVPDGGFKLLQGMEKKFTPEIENETGCSFLWTVNGVEVSKEKEFEYKESAVGSYQLCFTAKNDDGEDSEEFNVTICTPQELPFSWKFPQTEFNLSVGRRVKVKAYFIENDFGAKYSWTLNGEVQESDSLAYVFEGTTEGQYRLTLKMEGSYVSASQDITINVCPPEGTFRRPATAASEASINRVYAYVPAPGHQVNGYMYGNKYTAVTQEQANEQCAAFLANDGGGKVSLGACGGYIIAGFDHSVQNSGDYDIQIQGDAYIYQSEPGIIWVSQDENGDGLPNDTWYELKGSEYGGPNEIFEYAITYYQPTKSQSAIKWTDNLGNSGTVEHMTYWNPADTYYQAWLPQGSCTFYCSRLATNTTVADNGYTDVKPYPWGYADNAGSDNPEGYLGGSVFKISNAMTFDHKPADLKYIDFIKIQTGQVGKTDLLGENSTEVYSIRDFHLVKK